MRPDPRSIFYRSHRTSLLTYAGRLSGDPTSAEDIVQDAWLLFDQQRKATPIHEPLAYLKRIVRNLVFAEARRHRRVGITVSAEVADVAGELTDSQPSADAALIAKDELALVGEVLNGLPERQRMAFQLYYFEDLKLRQVAERLGVSVSLAHLLVTEAMQLCDERRHRTATCRR